MANKQWINGIGLIVLSALGLYDHQHQQKGKTQTIRIEQKADQTNSIESQTNESKRNQIEMTFSCFSRFDHWTKYWNWHYLRECVPYTHSCIQKSIAKLCTRRQSKMNGKMTCKNQTSQQFQHERKRPTSLDINMTPLNLCRFNSILIIVPTMNLRFAVVRLLRNWCKSFWIVYCGVWST